MAGPESESGKSNELPQSIIKKLYLPHVQHMRVGENQFNSPHVARPDIREQAHDKMSAEANLGKSKSTENSASSVDAIETMKKDAAILQQSDGHPRGVRINNLINVEALMNIAINAEEKLLEIPAVQELYKQGEAVAKKFQEIQKSVSNMQKQVPDVPDKDKKTHDGGKG